MTMAQVLEELKAQGERQQEFQEDVLGRLEALETRDADEREDEATEHAETPEGEHAEEAEGRMGEGEDEDDDERMDSPDHDSDMETAKGKSTAGKGRGMTRAQIRQAARERESKARSGRYGDKVIQPDPGPSRNKQGDAGMSLGHMLRSALSGGHLKSGYRELEYLEERYIPFGRDGTTIPWDFLATYGRHAEKIDRKLADPDLAHIGRKRIHGGYVEEQYSVMGEDGHLRTLNVSGGGGMVGVNLDVARSQMWLHEVSPVLGYMNPVMGVMSEYQIWFGGTAPTGSFVAEGAAHTENTPTLQRRRLSPRMVHFPWSISGELLSMDAVGIESLVQDGVENQAMQLVVRGFLSGDEIGTNFVEDMDAITGLWQSGGTISTFGAGGNTAIVAFNRAVVMNAEGQLRLNNALGEGLFWTLGTTLANYAVNQRVGGTEAIVYLAQRDTDRFREGLIGGTMLGMGTRYVETNQLGRTNTSAFKRTAIATVGFGSQMVPIFFGQGIEFRMVRLPGSTQTSYSFQIPINFVLVNNANMVRVAQA